MDRQVASTSVAPDEVGTRSAGRGSYIDDIWVLHAPDGSGTYELDFNTRFSEIASWQKQLAKNYFYTFVSEVDEKFVLSCSLVRAHIRTSQLSAIFRSANSKYSGRPLGDLSDGELSEIAMHNMDGSLSSFSTARERIRLLSYLYDLRINGNCLVPEEFLPSCELYGNWEEFAADLVKKAGKSFVDWKAGGSFDIVPFEVALALLAYCIDLIESDETKYILAWYRTERKWTQTNGAPPGLAAVRQMISNFGGSYHPHAHRTRALDEAYFKELQGFYPHAEHQDQLPLSSIPFLVRSQGGHRGSLIAMSNHLLTICFFAIIILTGIRQSEARTMSADAFKKSGKTYTFTSIIYKTNYGVETDRDTSDIVSKFIDVLDGLGSFGLGDERRPELFSYVRYRYTIRQHSLYRLGANGHNVGLRTRTSYEGFLETQAEEMREHCPHVTPHGFRHTWAEFAMRRFDGNIMPLIRDHYRHEFGSNMTGAYTHDKIELSEYQELGKRQIFELVSRYIDGAAALYGQLGEFLTARVKEIGLIEMHDRQTRDEAIEQIIEEHIGDPIITPHEYGLCVLREHTKSLANCRDENGIPQTETADISNCAGCVNSCMVKQLDGKEDTHPLELERQLEALKEEIRIWKDNELIGGLFMDEARKTYRALQAIKTKMDATNE